jgi:hypothetical protein
MHHALEVALLQILAIGNHKIYCEHLYTSALIKKLACINNYYSLYLEEVHNLNVRLDIKVLYAVNALALIRIKLSTMQELD